jgi:hypothetical protein
MIHIKVINKGMISYTDFYDGVPKKFAAEIGKKDAKGINLTPEEARHIFGVDFPETVEECKDKEFRLKILRHLSRRWGWNQSAEMEQKGKEAFAHFRFTPVEMQVVELVPTSSLPAPREEEDAEEVAV